jgi:hypothetical protein
VPNPRHRLALLDDAVCERSLRAFGESVVNWFSLNSVDGLVFVVGDWRRRIVFYYFAFRLLNWFVNPPRGRALLQGFNRDGGVAGRSLHRLEDRIVSHPPHFRGLLVIAQNPGLLLSVVLTHSRQFLGSGLDLLEVSGRLSLGHVEPCMLAQRILYVEVRVVSWAWDFLFLSLDDGDVVVLHGGHFGDAEDLGLVEVGVVLNELVALDSILTQVLARGFDHVLHRDLVLGLGQPDTLVHFVHLLDGTRSHTPWTVLVDHRVWQR